MILNWRCPENPQAGGAELVTFALARRLVKQGHSVEWFSASFPGAKPAADLEGVSIVRGGRQWTVHWAAFRRYRANLARDFDVVIDEINTIPFFTPMWSDIPVVMFVHQLAREVWWYEAVFPLNAIGYLAEPLYLRLYRHVPVVTVSQSTKDDLSQLGFLKPIMIIPEGIEVPLARQPMKSSEPKFVYVGRLAPSKRLEHMIRALALYRGSTGHGALCLVGGGSVRYQQALAKLARRLGIEDSVEFRGWVDDSEKYRLMADAHCLLMTSVREGWGLVVSEASACGTPSIVYDVPGLRDSVRNDATGLVVAPEPGSLSDAMIRMTSDPKLYARLAAEGQRWAGTLSFDDAARMVGETLQSAVAA